MARDLQQLLRETAFEPGELDVVAVRRDAARRRRIVRLAAWTTAGAVTVVVVAAVVSLSGVPDSPVIGPAPSPADAFPTYEDSPQRANQGIVWWHEELAGGGVSSHGDWIVVNSDTVFTTATVRATELLALDVATGEERWRTTVDSQAVLPLLATEDLVVVGTQQPHIYALDADSGEVVWDLMLDDGYEPTAAVLAADTVLLTADAPTEGDLRPPVVLAVAISDGEVVWTTRLREDEAVQWAAPSVIGPAVIVRTTPDGERERSGVHALDRDNGALLWSRDVGRRLDATSFTEVNGHATGDLIHIPIPDGASVTLDTTNGDTVWEAPDAWPLGGTESALVMTDGNRIYSVDPRTGSTLAEGQAVQLQESSSWLVDVEAHPTVLVPTRSGVAVAEPEIAQLSQRHTLPVSINKIVRVGDHLVIASNDAGVLVVRARRL